MSAHPRRVLVITGSGISADSGIPTFRGNEGYWRNNDPMKLATPEGFASDPKLVWEWYQERRRLIREKNPNAGHNAVVAFERSADGFLLITQNVDDLHERSGCDTSKLVHIHGDIFINRCTRCAHCERVDTTEKLPRCPCCAAPLRPGVVWFGEALPSDQVERVENFLSRGSCDLVLVVGTTAAFGYILEWAVRASNPGGRLIEVNPEPTPLSQFAHEVLAERAAVALPSLHRRLFG